MITTTPSAAAARRQGMTHVETDAFGLARIGRSTHALMGIRYNNGEGGAAPAAPAASGGTGPEPAQQPAATPTPTPTPSAPAQQPAQAEPPAKVRFEDLDPTTQAHVRDLRSEAASHRQAKESAERERDEAIAVKNRVLAAVGLNPDGSEQAPTPEELQQHLQTSQASAEATQRENLVLRVGPGLGANVDRLLDSRAFAAKLSAVKADDRGAVEALIREAIEQDSTLRSAPAPAASSGGTQHTGTTPAGQRKSMTAALEARYAGR